MPTRKFPLLTIVRDRLHPYVTAAITLYYRRLFGMKIGEGVRISLSAKLDKSNPKGIEIGDYTIVTLRSTLLSHDYATGRSLPVRIGRNCLIGCGAVILPGVTIGDECIVGAGAVVSRDVPRGSIVAGNPARVVRSGIRTGRWGRLIESGGTPPALGQEPVTGPSGGAAAAHLPGSARF